MSEINTKTMNREELETTATDLGLPFPHNISDEKLRAKIDEALGDTSGAGDTGSGDTAGATVTSHDSDTQDAKPAEKQFEIIIATHDQDKQPVQVGINGKNHVIQRGKKVIVSGAVVEVLQNAVQFQYDPNTMERTEVLSYPFQIVREV